MELNCNFVGRDCCRSVKVRVAWNCEGMVSIKHLDAEIFLGFVHRLLKFPDDLLDNPSIPFCKDTMNESIQHLRNVSSGGEQQST